jgi:tripartite-type tricarboxylate transporter receptor subunit TctC
MWSTSPEPAVRFPVAVSVQANSPYKTMKDLVEAAKANPGSIKFGTAGIMSVNHLAMLQLEKAIGAKLTFVHFDGGAPEVTALLGGHIDVATNVASEITQYRVLGVA